MKLHGKPPSKRECETVSAEWLESLSLIRSLIKWEISKQHPAAKALMA